VLAALLLFSFDSASVAQSKPSEYEVKAAYLYNFGKFMTWPADPHSPSFRVCILGSDPFGDALERTVKGETLNGKPVSLKHVLADGVTGCEIIFIPASEQKKLPSVLNLLKKQHVLTVSDIPQFVDKGGMIGFVMDGDRVRFEVNQAIAQDAGLQMSSQLLKVAKQVRTAREEK
jgi:uncharacterized protein DUF4154